MQGGSIPKQFSKNKPCYFCGASPPSSREHAPVKAMFEAFDCDSITVPACDMHNTKRSLSDRAIVSFFLRGLESRFRNGNLTQNQILAYDKARGKLGLAKEVTSHPMLWDPTGTLDDVLPHIDETEKVRAWMRQLTAAIVWSALGVYDQSCKWDEAEAWSPNFLPDPAPASLLVAGDKLRKLQSIRQKVDAHAGHWWPGWSSSPRPYPHDIYSFEVSFVLSEYLKPGGERDALLFRHWFYGGFSWYVWFEASEETKRALRNAVERVADGEGSVAVAFTD